MFMLGIQLDGKRAFVAGVSDDRGYGWAIVRALARARATVCVGTWPPTLGIFTKSLERGKLDTSLPEGGSIQLERIYPFDAVYDTAAEVPGDVREDKRYKDLAAFTVQETADQLHKDFGESCLDVVVHSLDNGPEVQKPLIDTSRAGYLAAVSASAYSMVSMVQRFGPLARPGGAFVSPRLDRLIDTSNNATPAVKPRTDGVLETNVLTACPIGGPKALPRRKVR
jgi:enoyl-[acyl-carrier protein] reductase I